MLIQILQCIEGQGSNQLSRPSNLFINDEDGLVGRSRSLLAKKGTTCSVFRAVSRMKVR